TNAPWGIDGAALESRFGLPCFIINDFSAIAWGVLLLDPGAPGQLVPLRRPDGSMAECSTDGVIAVLGAGTGLGCGFITRDGGRPRVYPSEGGHAGIPAYDEDTRAFSLWLDRAYGFAAGAEAGVSGQGIANLFRFLAEHEGKPSAQVGAILKAVESERPAMIAAAAESDALCAKVMDMFVRLYARVASDLALTVLPTGGLFLAGGIAAKNERWFVDGFCFMDSFMRSYRQHVREIMEATPVYIVKDYGISIYGAAHAATILSAV
ncbi:MAG: glucokinase, partial [Spirochaetales bacterium]